MSFTLRSCDQTKVLGAPGRWLIRQMWKRFRGGGCQTDARRQSDVVSRRRSASSHWQMFNIDSPKKTIFKFEVFLLWLRLSGDYSFMINIISITITSSCFRGEGGGLRLPGYIWHVLFCFCWCWIILMDLKWMLLKVQFVPLSSRFGWKWLTAVFVLSGDPGESWWDTEKREALECWPILTWIW